MASARNKQAGGVVLAAVVIFVLALPAASGDAPLDAVSARRVLGFTGHSAAPSTEEVRAAFHKASLSTHPDKQGGSLEQFVRVSEAYEVLRNGGGFEGSSSAPPHHHQQQQHVYPQQQQQQWGTSSSSEGSKPHSTQSFPLQT
jgi:hypothetical protein